MDLKTYQALAKRTRKPMSTKFEDVAHMIFGLTSEIQRELDYAIEIKDLPNVREEIGDAMWYLINLYDVLDIIIDDQSYLQIQPISGSIGELCDVLKAQFVYEKPTAKFIPGASMLAIMSYLTITAKKHGFTLSECCETNIQKLLVRYPDKYTDELALNRNLNEEKEILKLNDSTKSNK